MKRQSIVRLNGWNEHDIAGNTYMQKRIIISLLLNGNCCTGAYERAHSVYVFFVFLHENEILSFEVGNEKMASA